MSGIAAAVGVLLLVAELGALVASPEDYRSLVGLGDAHCACLLVQYGLAIPVALILHRQNRAVAVDRSLAITALGVIAMTNIVEVQALILTGLLESHDRMSYLGVAFAVLVIWFLMAGRLGRSSGLLTGRTTLMSLLGASYVAYPVWAFWLARQLNGQTPEPGPTVAAGGPGSAE